MIVAVSMEVIATRLQVNVNVKMVTMVTSVNHLIIAVSMKIRISILPVEQEVGII